MTDRRQPPARGHQPPGRRGAAPRQPNRPPTQRRAGEPPRQGAPRQGAPRQTPPRQTPPRTAAARRPPQPPYRPRRKVKALRLGKLERRLRWGLAAVCTLLLVIGGRLVQLQGVDHTDYAGAATAQRVDHLTIHALRGPILDRSGTQLAYTSDAQDITADPKQVKAAVGSNPNSKLSYATYLAKLSGLLDVPETTLLTELTKPGEYAVLATGQPPVVADKIEALGLPGIYTQATTQRQYPAGTTAANIIGTVHSDGTGAAGIESRFNSVLAGKDGSQTYSVDNLGNVNPNSRTVVTPARNGSTVRLTIDQDLQFVAQHYLDNAVPLSGAKDAEMAVLDVHTGQVLALASSGTFDAADPNSINPDEPIDPPVMSAFEPGSVQKAITFAAALQEHVITPRSVFDVADSIETGGVRIADAWQHRTSPFYATGILAESSNVGTLLIADKLGPKTWYRYEKLFGVGDKTGIELPGESPGYVPPLKDWSASTFANLPFGQGESMTILQLASIYQAIANNGVRIPPRVVQSTTRADGTVTTTKQPTGIRVVDPSVSKTLRTMLESVTLPGGTGTKAAIPGYTVAGKTGTAQQPVSSGGAYSNSKNWDTFAGMVPADNPQFVVAIMVDNPAHGVEGGDVAAPLFHQIASYEVQHAHVAPSGATSKYVPLQDCKGQNPAFLPRNVCFG